MQAQSTNRGERANAALAEVVQLFESGELPAAVARSTIARLGSDAPSASWSLGNRLLMLLAGTEDARGYRQWQEAGRHVNKGARAFHILGPSTRKVAERDPVTGEEVERVAVVGFHAIPVFRIEDTEGAPVERADYTPAQLPPLFEVAERLGVAVSWLPYADRYYGYYAPGREQIVLCSPDAAVFFHELAHAAHARVLAQSGRALRGGQNAAQEIVAETVAAVLARMYDFELGAVATSREYVARYAGAKGPGAAVMRVLADVQAVLDLLLSLAEAPAVVDADAELAGVS